MSKCLGSAKCRWNGEIIPDKFVEKLKPHVEFMTACPEADIALSVPRNPVRIVKRGDGYKVMQMNTGKHITG